MSEQEFKEFVNSLKEQGLTDEEILDIFYQPFKDGEITLESLKAAANSMGYRLKGEFEQEVSQGGGEGGEGGGDLGKEQVEAAKEIKEGESEGEFKERVAKGETAEESDEDSERKEAFKYLN